MQGGGYDGYHRSYVVRPMETKAGYFELAIFRYYGLHHSPLSLPTSPFGKANPFPGNQGMANLPHALNFKKYTVHINLEVIYKIVDKNQI